VGKDGSSWAVVNDTYRVIGCPSGWIIIRDDFSVGAAVLDQCYKCPGVPYPGFYSKNPASFPGKIVPDEVANDVLGRFACICRFLHRYANGSRS
jgi:hypothetical protein